MNFVAVFFLCSLLLVCSTWDYNKLPAPATYYTYDGHGYTEIRAGQFVDVNGDGLVDYVVDLIRTDLANAWTDQIYINNGHNFVLGGSLTEEEKMTLISRKEQCPEILTVAKASVYLETDQAYVLELLETGKIPGKKIGGEWKLTKQALLAFLDS